MGGHITCSLIGCPDPCAVANSLLAPPKPRKVTIELDEDVAQRLAGVRLLDDGDHRIVAAACWAALDGDK
jgi:hypothetical protein